MLDDRVRIFSAGFQAHVVKPMDPAELVAAVASPAHRRRRADRGKLVEPIIDT